VSKIISGKKITSIYAVNACSVISSGCVKTAELVDGNGCKKFAKQEKALD
jgi:hypothetical protein